jgi:hypothetical protein
MTIDGRIILKCISTNSGGMRKIHLAQNEEM